MLPLPPRTPRRHLVRPAFDNFALRLTRVGRRAESTWPSKRRRGLAPSPAFGYRSCPGCALAVLALLAVSQALWLWHSWPVRELLDRDQFVVGLSSLAI